jgi:hypothetical protein
MTETKIRQYLKKLLKYEIDNGLIQFQPIESGSTGIGIPDIYFASDRKEGWIELKILKKKGTSLIVPYRPGQWNWIQKRMHLNKRTYLFAYYQNKIYVYFNENIRKEYSEKITNLAYYENLAYYDYYFTVLDFSQFDKEELKEILF